MDLELEFVIRGLRQSQDFIACPQPTISASLLVSDLDVLAAETIPPRDEPPIPSPERRSPQSRLSLGQNALERPPDAVPSDKSKTKRYVSLVNPIRI